jgi:hypothetical protein
VEQGFAAGGRRTAVKNNACAFRSSAHAFRVVGLATVAVPGTMPLRFRSQQLRVLSTVLAVSLENAKLFSRVITDGLTNLYTRASMKSAGGRTLQTETRQSSCRSSCFDLTISRRSTIRFGHLVAMTFCDSSAAHAGAYPQGSYACQPLRR